MSIILTAWFKRIKILCEFAIQINTGLFDDNYLNFCCFESFKLMVNFSVYLCFYSYFNMPYIAIRRWIYVIIAINRIRYSQGYSLSPTLIIVSAAIPEVAAMPKSKALVPQTAINVASYKTVYQVQAHLWEWLDQNPCTDHHCHKAHDRQHNPGRDNQTEPACLRSINGNGHRIYVTESRHSHLRCAWGCPYHLWW